MGAAEWATAGRLQGWRAGEGDPLQGRPSIGPGRQRTWACRVPGLQGREQFWQMPHKKGARETKTLGAGPSAPRRPDRRLVGMCRGRAAKAAQVRRALGSVHRVHTVQVPPPAGQGGGGRTSASHGPLQRPAAR